MKLCDDKLKKEEKKKAKKNQLPVGFGADGDYLLLSTLNRSTQSSFRNVQEDFLLGIYSVHLFFFFFLASTGFVHHRDQIAESSISYDKKALKILLRF